MNDVQQPRTHLFMVRVWLEDLGAGKTEWRGQVKNVMSSEVRYFRGWSGLAQQLKNMLSGKTMNFKEVSDAKDKLSPAD